MRSYFDHNATTPPDPAVIEAVARALTEDFGNASSVHHFGQRAKALLDEARGAGYSAMLLDTLDDMEAARELYATLGFDEIPPYYFNPIPGAHYLKADLT